MSYILVIWTIVGFAGTQSSTYAKYDWRPIGEFHMDNWERKLSAKEMCEAAARELAIEPNKYRCVRNK